MHWWINEKLDIEIRRGVHWARLRVKKKNKEQYLDVLSGRVDENRHSHVGYSLPDGRPFTESRNLVHSIEKEIVKSDLIERNIDVIEPGLQYNAIVLLSTLMNQTTGEVVVDHFEILLTEEELGERNRIIFENNKARNGIRPKNRILEDSV